MQDPVIQTSKLYVRFGTHEVLQGIEFELAAGDFLAVVGPNGSGKTTLIKTLLGLVEPHTGHVRVFGNSPGDAAPDRIGYVPQIKTLDRSFPALTIELVVTGLTRHWPARISAADQSRAMDALEQVGAAGFAQRPLGELSGGELQRVYLARTLVRRPELILLDEPATGIDTGGASDLYEMLERFQEKQEATIVMVTHDLNAAFHHASHVLLIDEQQLGFGPPGDALSEEQLRRAFGHVDHPHLMQPRGPGHG